MEAFQAQTEAFAEQVEQELRDGTLSFPTVFDLSLRIKRLADDPDSSLADIANVVRAEPLLAAKAIRMANTLSMNPYRGEIDSLKDAIGRIGLSTLRCLAFAVAAEQLARDHRSRQMRLIATGLWMHAIDVAAWSFALARALDRPNPDGAMLAGLMLDIGQFYLLARAARYPALEGDLPRFAELVALWDEPVRTAVLETFDLPDSIIEACTADPTARTEWPPESMSDIVFLATLAAEAPNPFDSLLGLDNRAALRDTCIAGLDRSKYDELLEAAQAGRLLGIKTVLNELLAYLELARMSPTELSERTRIVLTYAMCGFANIGSLGILIAGLGEMAPTRRAEVLRLGPRAVLAGTLATLSTGAVVSVLL